MQFSPTFFLRTYFSSHWFIKNTSVHWEDIERECISDYPTGCPTLADLGITRPVTCEERWVLSQILF